MSWPLQTCELWERTSRSPQCQLLRSRVFVLWWHRTVTALARGLEQQGVAQMTGLVYSSAPSSPSFAFRHVYRSPPYDPTTTLTFRVAGLDARTHETVILGCAQLAVFRDTKDAIDAASARQPADGSVSPVWLNEGAFQLPIYRGQPALRTPFTAMGVRRFPVVPCATLLVRLENLSDEEEVGTGTIAEGSCVRYHITVCTGVQDDAGTDSPVRLTLWGPLGCSGPHLLEDDKSFDPEFQAGSTDVFVLDIPDVGPLRHIRIGHDSDDGWFLRKVVVERRELGITWEFPCHRWLDIDKDDQCSYRTIAPSYLGSFEAGDSRQRATLPHYGDGLYDSSLCGDQSVNLAQWNQLALLDDQSKSFLELMVGTTATADDAATARALLDALPATLGTIDDGNGKADADSHDLEDIELFDALQSWVLRRTNIRPLTNVPVLRLATQSRSETQRPPTNHADQSQGKSDSRTCTLS